MTNSIDRWVILLRHKAETYEHTARKSGEAVYEPSIHDICNEMEAFKDGILILKGGI